MSTRKTTAFYAVLLVVASLFVGMVIASRFDLTPASSAQTIAVPPMNSAPLTGAARRVDLPQHREGGDADGRQHPDGDEGEGPGSVRLLRRRAASLTISSTASSADRAAAAGRRPGRPAPPQAAATDGRTPEGADDARRRHRVHHQQGRLHPRPTTTWSRTRPRLKCRSTPTRRGRQLQGEGDRPRRADRQRADSADRQAEPPAARSEVRRFVAGRGRRLGDGDRQPVRLRAHRHASA